MSTMCRFGMSFAANDCGNRCCREGFSISRQRGRQLRFTALFAFKILGDSVMRFCTRSTSFESRIHAGVRLRQKVQHGKSTEQPISSVVQKFSASNPECRVSMIAGLHASAIEGDSIEGLERKAGRLQWPLAFCDSSAISVSSVVRKLRFKSARTDAQQPNPAAARNPLGKRCDSSDRTADL